MSIIDRLQEYLLKVDNYIASENIQAIKVFTIGNTRIASDLKFYFAPIRKYQNVITAGVIVFSEEEATIIMSKIDGLFNYVLIDSEKKSISTNKVAGVFNLERLGSEIIKKSKTFRFKGNDLTINSIEDFIHGFLLRSGMLMGGKNVLVIGLGNIGFKITLRLVEVGMNIYVTNRTDSKIDKLIETINLVKPKETIASATNLREVDINKILPNIDIVILCTTSIIDNFEKYINLFKKEIIIIDVGKGCISNHIVNILRKKNIIVYRLDIGDALVQFILGNVLNKNMLELPQFKTLSNGTALLTKGIVGLEGDIVVDNVENPKILYGICNGKGSFYQIDKTQEQNILNSFFNN
jgi:hypothetical protein